MSVSVFRVGNLNIFVMGRAEMEYRGIAPRNGAYFAGVNAILTQHEHLYGKGGPLLSDATVYGLIKDLWDRYSPSKRYFSQCSCTKERSTLNLLEAKIRMAECFEMLERNSAVERYRDKIKHTVFDLLHVWEVCQVSGPPVYDRVRKISFTARDYGKWRYADPRGLRVKRYEAVSQEYGTETYMLASERGGHRIRRFRDLRPVVIDLLHDVSTEWRM